MDHGTPSHFFWGIKVTLEAGASGEPPVRRGQLGAAQATGSKQHEHRADAHLQGVAVVYEFDGDRRADRLDLGDLLVARRRNREAPRPLPAPKPTALS